jgi:ribosomal protein S21
MIEVIKNYSDEPFDKMLRRFKNKVRSSDLLNDLKKFESYEKPSEIKRRKKLAK